MSLLPQQKKSAEEIAKLRELLGHPGMLPSDEISPQEIAKPDIMLEDLVQLVTPQTPLPPPSHPTEPRPCKQVRSLRKSEQGLASTIRTQAADSRIPIQRRSDHELNELRRRESLANLAPKPNPQSLVAHLVLVIPAYLLLAFSTIGCFFYDLEIAMVASAVAVSLIIAGFIFFRKPLSRYHAGFIAVIAFFLIIFGTFHYFPQLLNGP